MSGPNNKPGEFDAVLGSQNLAPVGAVVLGGLPGVKQRLASPVVTARKNALQEALKYGEGGVNLLVRGLEDPSQEVQKVAYVLLSQLEKSRVTAAVRRALRGYLPYKLFECVRSQKVGSDIVISGNGKAIAYSKGKRIQILDLEEDQVVDSIPRLGRSSKKYQLAVDYTLVQFNAHLKTVEVWQDGELRHSLLGHQGGVNTIAIALDGAICATGGADAIIRLWQLKTGKLFATFSRHLILNAHGDRIVHLSFSVDGQRLISSSMDSTIKIWDLTTRDRPRTLKTYSPRTCLSPDGLTLATTDWHGNIKLWDISSQKLSRTIETRSYSCFPFCFSPYGRILITGNRGGLIQFWNVYTGEEFHSLEAHEGTIEGVVLCNEGKRLVTTGSDRTVKVWEVPIAF